MGKRLQDRIAGLLPEQSTPLTTENTQLLAIELAQDVYPLEQTLQRFNLTDDQLEYVKTTKQFKQVYNEACLVWNSDASALDRVKIKSKAVLEFLLLPAIRDALVARQYGPAQLPAVAKTLMEMSGAAAGKADDGGGQLAAPKLSITISLGEGNTLTTEIAGNSRSIDGEVQRVE